MRRRTLLATLVATLIVLSTHIAVIPVTQTTAHPFPELVTEDPAPAFPTSALPGSTFQIVLKNGYNAGDVEAVRIEAVTLEDEQLVKHTYDLSIQSASGNTLTVVVPGDAAPGLYDLYITISGTTHMVERSVWILRSMPQYLLVSHSSDHHAFIASKEKRVAGMILSQILGVQMAFITGDATDQAGEKEYYDLLSVLESFIPQTPVLMVPGNHDWGTENFQKYAGPRKWYRRIGDFLIIGYDTKEPGLAGVELASDEEMAWLENILQANSDAKVKIVLMHHPVFYYHGTIEASYDTLDASKLSYYWGAPGGDYPQYEKYARQFLKMCEDYNITLVLAGHIHRDQLVVYKSARTGTTTYFVTTTTLAQSRARDAYNGFQAINITADGEISFPFAPPSFRMNGSYRGLMNGLSVDPAKPTYFYARYDVGTAGLGFSLTNHLEHLDLSNTIILRFPWEHGDNVKYYTYTEGGAQVEVKDYLVDGNYLYLAVSLSMPRGSFLSVAASSQEDTSPPSVQPVLTIPRTPRPGSPLTVYLDISDETGTAQLNINVTVEGEAWDYTLTRSGGHYVVEISPVPRGKTAELTVYAKDFTGKETLETFTYQFGQPETTTTTATETATTTTPPTETTATTTTTTTTTATTTPPATATTTTTQTTTTTTTTTTTPPTETTATTTTPAGRGVPTALLVLVVVVVAIVVLAASRRR